MNINYDLLVLFGMGLLGGSLFGIANAIWHIYPWTKKSVSLGLTIVALVVGTILVVVGLIYG